MKDNNYPDALTVRRQIFLCLALSFCIINSARPQNDAPAYRQKDTNAVNPYILKAEKLISSNTDSAIFYLKIPFENSLHHFCKRDFVLSGLLLSKAYRYRSLYNDAEKTVQYVLFYARNINDDTLIAKCYLSLGEIKRADTRFDKAVSVLQKSLALYKKHDHKKGIAWCYNRLSAVYYEKSEMGLAEIFADSSNQIAYEPRFKEIISSNEELLAEIFRQTGRMELWLEKMQSALKWSSGDSTDIANIYLALANYHLNNGKPDLAAKEASTALQFAEKSGITLYKVRALYILARCEKAFGNIEKAWYYNHISDSLRLSGQYMNMMKYKMDLREKIDSMNTENEKLRLTRDLDLEQASVRKRNYVILFTIVVLVIVFIAFVLIFIARRRLSVANALLQKQKMEIAMQKEEVSEAYQKLKNLEEFKELMMGMIVHDLVNPLGVILNPPESFSNNEKIEFMKRSGQRMIILVMNILDVQKFESNSIVPELEPYRLFELANSAISQVFHLQKEKQLSIFNSIPMDITVMADQYLITRVFVNLLLNAIKFSEAGGEIEITAYALDEQVSISVMDHGSGIAAEVIDKVFDKFHQHEARPSGMMRSTGLGLTFCRMAVEAHGSGISVESDPDQQTTFSFVLKKGEGNIGHPGLNYNERNDTIKPLIERENKIKLEPYLAKLRTIKIYKISEINAVLNDIPVTDHPVISLWLAELKKAVSSGNERMFNKLIDENYFGIL